MLLYILNFGHFLVKMFKLFTAYYLSGLVISQELLSRSLLIKRFDPIYFQIHVPAFIVSDSLVHVIPKN